MVHYTKCPLCSSEEIGKYLKTDDHFLSKETFLLFKCSGCGFIFTQDHPDESEIGHYYKSEKYLSHNDTVHGFSDILYRLSRNVMLKKKLRIIKRFTGLRKGNLLDVGTGSGHFAAFMKEKGWIVKGIEINEKVREVSVSRFGLDILSPGQIITLQSEGFDCVTLWHVLEHLQDPFKYASEIRRLLKPGGTCIVALPNCNSYDAYYYKAFWAAYDVPRHLWHFTPQTFKNFTEKTGFMLKEIKTLSFDVFYIASLSEKYKMSNLHFISGMIRGLWFAFLSWFKKDRSSSLIYLLKK